MEKILFHKPGPAGAEVFRCKLKGGCAAGGGALPGGLAGLSCRGHGVLGLA